MHQLLYVSRAAQDIPASDLDDILAVARKNNMAQGVTGMLLHIDGGFLQLLEGARETVEALYARIAADPRHANPRLLLNRAVPSRVFAGWALGYEHLAGGGGEIEGMFGITREAIAGRLSPGAGRVVAAMLETFYRLQMGEELLLSRIA